MKRFMWLVQIIVLVVLVASCAPATPAVVEKEKIVEKAVPQTVVVEKEKIVEKTVQQTVVVEKEKIVEKVVQATQPPRPSGGNLVFAMDASTEPALLDVQIDPFKSTGLIDSFLADSLVCRDPQTMEIKPWLATDWQISGDGLSWTFHLRKDVKFQDGTPFNAEAVKVNLDRILAPETQSVEAAARLGPVQSVEVIDPYTVKVTHKRPYSPFLDSFAILEEPIWSPTALKKYGYADFPKHLVGSGPFIFKENVPKDHVTVVRNPDYNWAPACVDHTGPAYLDSFTIKWVAEAAVRGGIVKTGEAQATQTDPQFIAQYEKDPKYQVVLGYQPGSGQQSVMNSAKPPLDDARVRKAILHSVVRDSINKMLFAGRYMQSYGPVMPNTLCYWAGAETMYPYDLDKANALLDEAGWKVNPATRIRVKDGKPLTVRWTVLSRANVGEALAAQLKQVGIDLKVEQVAGPVQIDMATRRDFDLMYERQRGNDPVFLDLIWNSKNSGAGGWAWTGFKDDKLDQALDKANTETDMTKRCEYYTEVQKIIMENALVLGTFDDPMIYVLNANVKGFQLGPTAWMFYPYNLRIEK